MSLSCLNRFGETLEGGCWCNECFIAVCYMERSLGRKSSAKTSWRVLGIVVILTMCWTLLALASVEAEKKDFKSTSDMTLCRMDENDFSRRNSCTMISIKKIWEEKVKHVLFYVEFLLKLRLKIHQQFHLNFIKIISLIISFISTGFNHQSYIIANKKSMSNEMNISTWNYLMNYFRLHYKYDGIVWLVIRKIRNVVIEKTQITLAHLFFLIN